MFYERSDGLLQNMFNYNIDFLFIAAVTVIGGALLVLKCNRFPQHVGFILRDLSGSSTFNDDCYFDTSVRW